MGPGTRWLVVTPHGQTEMGLVLQKPEPALHGEGRAAEMAKLIGKGTTWVFHAHRLEETVQELTAKGVKFVEPPKKMLWGNQAIFEDPYGNCYALMSEDE